jgi:two-component system, sensor histidine kinase and response regulator
MTKILAIEDEKVILDNIMEILEVAGMDVHGALDGVEGVQMAHDLLPDVILCDINMPEIDGYSVLMELRSDPTTALIPFIFLTAYVDKPFQRKGMNLGAADYLTKPFTARDLLETIEAQVGKRDQHDKLRTTEMEALRSSIVLALPHELRTPLTGIITCADMLLMDFDEGVTPEPQRTEQMVRIIHRSGQRLQRLVENYLVYSQIEIYTNNPDSPPNLRLGEGITNPIQVVEKAGAQVAIEQQREGDLHIGDLLEARVQVSERNLHKIVTEIADNAFKFSKQIGRASCRERV